jgi:hypothetical protein
VPGATGAQVEATAAFPGWSGGFKRPATARTCRSTHWRITR